MADEPIPPIKTCTKCGIQKPATTEFYTRHKECRGGLDSRCKACILEYGKRWRRGEALGPPKGMTADGLRICNHCAVAKKPNKENFAPTPRGRLGLHATCRPCLIRMERLRAGRPDDPFANGWVHDGRKRCAKCHEIKSASADHFANSGKGYRSGLRPYCKACTKIDAAHRRAGKRQAKGTFTKDHVAKMNAAQAGRCWWCGRMLTKYHIDHRIPLSRGGSNGPENLVLACPPCNLRKHAKMPWEMEVPRLL